MWDAGRDLPSVSTLTWYRWGRPQLLVTNWTLFQAKARASIPIAELLNAGTHLPISLPAPGLQKIWVWRDAVLHDWVT